MVQFWGFPRRRGRELRIVIQRTRHRVAAVYSTVKSKMSIRNDIHSSNSGAKTIGQKPHLCVVRKRATTACEGLEGAEPRNVEALVFNADGEQQVANIVSTDSKSPRSGQSCWV